MVVATPSSQEQETLRNGSSWGGGGDHGETSRRAKLLNSENDNGNVDNPRRAKSRSVCSRYLSPSTSTSTSTSNSTSNLSTVSSSSSSSRRYNSPLVSRDSRNGLNGGLKRSVSVDRRQSVVSRALTPDLDLKGKGGDSGGVLVGSKMLVTSARSLSVSFQGEAFAMPISKTKVAPASPNLSSVRRGTPERRRISSPLRGRGRGNGCGDQVEDLKDSKPTDQHRWPGRTRQENSLSRSLNCGAEERRKVIGSGNVVRAMQASLVDERRSTFGGRLSIDLANDVTLKASENVPGRNSLCNESSVASDLTASDTDSVSSGSIGAQDFVGASRMRNGPRGIAGSAKFWQETNSRLRRLQDPGPPCSPRPKLIVPPKVRKLPSDSILSSPRTMSSPIRGLRTASPSKQITPRASSPSRGMPSPSRVRNAVSTISNSFTESPSVLSFAVDVRRGKVGENRISDAHYLRLLYNRHLQWRFVNARTEELLLVQTHIAEKTLWGAWITISDLRDKVTKRRHRLQLLRQKLKLVSILKGQITCLETWASLDKDHYTSLCGGIEALKASTLRLPAGGATADIQSLKDAMGSAVDLMQATLSSICLFLPKVEKVNSLVNELTGVTAKERSSLEKCEDFLSKLAALEIKDCSLRTQIIQQKRGPTI